MTNLQTVDFKAVKCPDTGTLTLEVADKVAAAALIALCVENAELYTFEEAFDLAVACEPMLCPDCAGTGAQVVNTGLMPEHGNLEQWACDRCNGTGDNGATAQLAESCEESA